MYMLKVNRLLIEKLLIVLLLISPLLSSGQANLDSLKQVLSELPRDSQRVSTNLKIYEVLRFENPKEATSYLLKALQLAETIQYKKGIVKSYLSIG